MVCEGGPIGCPVDDVDAPVAVGDTTVLTLSPGGGAIPGGICSAVGLTLKRRLNFD